MTDQSKPTVTYHFDVRSRDRTTPAQRQAIEAKLNELHPGVSFDIRVLKGTTYLLEGGRLIQPRPSFTAYCVSVSADSLPTSVDLTFIMESEGPRFIGAE